MTSEISNNVDMRSSLYMSIVHFHSIISNITIQICVQLSRYSLVIL